EHTAHQILIVERGEDQSVWYRACLIQQMHVFGVQRRLIIRNRFGAHRDQEQLFCSDRPTQPIRRAGGQEEKQERRVIVWSNAAVLKDKVTRADLYDFRRE